MSTDSDDLNAKIDAWTQEQLAASPDWSMEGRPGLAMGEQEMTCPPIAISWSLSAAQASSCLSDGR
ncbi:hypothetical protein [Streptomyces albipurpureus]|uniref:Uncharacterized protein n=1 Tax=Streptomyces albipurpureus TaxID=2897419 RepID=A0ABT0UMI3_9ACTN|nr:hypothetical protein [Streptomyces sp. CWNU-1]MCM2389229.1 hypothetical protein [Streptomyces sp. CWNU-1]